MSTRGQHAGPKPPRMPRSRCRASRSCDQHRPAGVLNLLTGYGEECGAALARHPLVRKLSFTGSTEVGKLVMHAAADRIVPVSLELGGKSPAIVFPDADEARTVDGVIAGMRVTRQGQSCTAGSRLFLHCSIFESFLTKLAAKLATLKIGDPSDEATDMGAIINRKQYDRVCCISKTGSARSRPASCSGTAAIFRAARRRILRPADGVCRREQRLAHRPRKFSGPVMVAIAWEHEDEAIRMANDSHYGLAAHVWTHDIAKAIHGARDRVRLDSDQSGLGQFPDSPTAAQAERFGREYSLEGMLDSFTQRKSVTVNLQS